VLLERNELTSGSTWHAAGNVPTFSASWSVMNMQRYSTELYRRLWHCFAGAKAAKVDMIPAFGLDRGRHEGR
jgi:glycine/D-amino acid oxidase-like deaminating enzyme